MSADYSKLSGILDPVLKSVDFSKTNEEGVNAGLPDGYYLCQVEKAELTESKSGNPMVVIEFMTIEDGKKAEVGEDGYSKLVTVRNTANKKIFCNYVLTNEMNIGFFVSDMLKFQDPETNEPLFPKTRFETTKGIIEVCEDLTAGGVIYLMLQTIEKDGKPDQKKRPISWKRASRLELI